MNILQNEFDISIENYLEITNLNNLKKDTEFFINTSESFLNNLNEIGLESFTQLLPPIMKLGRIFQLRKSVTEYPKNGMFL